MATPSPRERRPPRTSTGVPGLDPLLEGGFPAGRAVLLCGAPGTGKTTVALQFLCAGAARGEPGVLLTVDEKPAHILSDAEAFDGLDLQRHVDAGRVAILDAAPFFTTLRGAWRRTDVDARAVAADLTRHSRAMNARRLVLDPVSSLVPPALDRGEAEDYLRSLVHSLEDNLECTVLLTCRASGDSPAYDTLRHLASGVIDLAIERAGGGVSRYLRVQKMRATAADLDDHAFVIEEGLGAALVGPAPPAVREVLTLRPRPVAAAAPPPSDRPAVV